MVTPAKPRAPTPRTGPSRKLCAPPLRSDLIDPPVAHYGRIEAAPATAALIEFGSVVDAMS